MKTQKEIEFELQKRLDCKDKNKFQTYSQLRRNGDVIDTLLWILDKRLVLK
jgi:hypothetical protein